MTPFSYLTPKEIRDYDPIQLGMGGFCFLVAEMLKAKCPSAELWKLTNRDGTMYRHVFVRVNGKPYDIKGGRNVDEMRFDLGDYGLVEKMADAQAIHDYFYPLYPSEQLAAARAALYDTVMRLNCE